MNTKTVIRLSDRAKLCLIIAVLLPLGCSHMSSSQTDVSRITKEEAVPMLGRADVIVVDVRSARGWKESESKITGSVREGREDGNNAWMEKYPKNKTLIFYCA